tara:strand:+ start:425 stop:814 length:390 start_codon:yes stop_codon:yes gene_type:complete
MLGAGAYSFIMVSLRRYRSVSDKKIKEISFGGYEFGVNQIVYAYDTNRKNLSGFLVTTSTVSGLAKLAGSWSALLYVKAETADKGLWELSLPNTRLQQVEDDVIWFHSDGSHSFKILISNKRRSGDFDD